MCEWVKAGKKVVVLILRCSADEIIGDSTTAPVASPCRAGIFLSRLPAVSQLLSQKRKEITKCDELVVG